MLAAPFRHLPLPSRRRPQPKSYQYERLPPCIVRCLATVHFGLMQKLEGVDAASNPDALTLSFISSRGHLFNHDSIFVADRRTGFYLCCGVNSENEQLQIGCANPDCGPLTRRKKRELSADLPL